LDAKVSFNPEKPAQQADKVEIKEIIKYVDNPNCEACEKLRNELADLRAQLTTIESERQSE